MTRLALLALPYTLAGILCDGPIDGPPPGAAVHATTETTP